jgi:hypothetical protein
MLCANVGARKMPCGGESDHGGWYPTLIPIPGTLCGAFFL